MITLQSNIILRNRLKEVQDVFQNTELFLANSHTEQEIVRYFNSLNSHFYPVAIEALSFYFAEMELEKDESLRQWNKWFNYFPSEFQLFFFVGLGMAISKMEIPLTKVIYDRKHPLSDLIFDGMGYYDGLFRARRTIRNHAMNENVPKDKLDLYNQGLGRRLWYYAEGDPSRINDIILTFDENRQNSLMRGLGIAYSFVEELIEWDLSNYNNEKQVSFLVGILLVYDFRLSTGNFSDPLLHKIRNIGSLDKLVLDDFLNNEMNILPIQTRIKKLEESLKFNIKNKPYA